MIAAHGDRVSQPGADQHVVAIDQDEVDVEVIVRRRDRLPAARMMPREAGLVQVATTATTPGPSSPTVVIDADDQARGMGLDHAGSDEDHRGVFRAVHVDAAGRAADVQSLDGSTSWNWRKIIRQALRAQSRRPWGSCSPPARPRTSWSNASSIRRHLRAPGDLRFRPRARGSIGSRSPAPRRSPRPRARLADRQSTLASTRWNGSPPPRTSLGHRVEARAPRPRLPQRSTARSTIRPSPAAEWRIH